MVPVNADTMQYNFSTYTVFWDNLLGTTWADKEGAEKRYQRVRDLTRRKGTLKAEEPVLDRKLEMEVAGGRKVE